MLVGLEKMRNLSKIKFFIIIIVKVSLDDSAIIDLYRVRANQRATKNKFLKYLEHERRCLEGQKENGWKHQKLILNVNLDILLLLKILKMSRSSLTLENWNFSNIFLWLLEVWKNSVDQLRSGLQKFGELSDSECSCSRGGGVGGLQNAQKREQDKFCMCKGNFQFR